MTYPVPQEVIVVEGRDDTRRLIETFGIGVKTIETGGSAIDAAVLQQIEAAQARFGVIVLTDPDHPGQRIRRIIERAVPAAAHAHLEQNQTQSGRRYGSLGVEHASPKDIYQALSQAVRPQGQAFNTEAADFAPAAEIPLSDLIQLQLVAHPLASQRRQATARHFKLGHLNGKQLQRQLANYGISYQALRAFLDEVSAANSDPTNEGGH